MILVVEIIFDTPHILALAFCRGGPIVAGERCRAGRDSEVAMSDRKYSSGTVAPSVPAVKETYKDTDFAPGCFGSPLAFEAASKECVGCEFLSKCGPIASESLAAIRTKHGIPSDKPLEPKWATIDANATSESSSEPLTILEQAKASVAALMARKTAIETAADDFKTEKREAKKLATAEARRERDRDRKRKFRDKMSKLAASRPEAIAPAPDLAAEHARRLSCLRAATSALKLDKQLTKIKGREAYYARAWHCSQVAGRDLDRASSLARIAEIYNLYVEANKPGPNASLREVVTAFNGGQIRSVNRYQIREALAVCASLERRGIW